MSKEIKVRIARIMNNFSQAIDDEIKKILEERREEKESQKLDPDIHNLRLFIEDLKNLEFPVMETEKGIKAINLCRHSISQLIRLARNSDLFMEELKRQ